MPTFEKPVMREEIFCSSVGNNRWEFRNVTMIMWLTIEVRREKFIRKSCSESDGNKKEKAVDS